MLFFFTHKKETIQIRAKKKLVKRGLLAICMEEVSSALSPPAKKLHDSSDTYCTKNTIEIPWNFFFFYKSLWLLFVVVKRGLLAIRMEEVSSAPNYIIPQFRHSRCARDNNDTHTHIEITQQKVIIMISEARKVCCAGFDVFILIFICCVRSFCFSGKLVRWRAFRLSASSSSVECIYSVRQLYQYNYGLHRTCHNFWKSGRGGGVRIRFASLKFRIHIIFVV